MTVRFIAGRFGYVGLNVCKMFESSLRVADVEMALHCTRSISRLVSPRETCSIWHCRYTGCYLLYDRRLEGVSETYSNNRLMALPSIPAPWVDFLETCLPVCEV